MHNIIKNLVVVVAFSLFARIWGECSTIYAPPALFFFLSGDLLARTYSTSQVRISQQRLSDLRRLRSNLP